MGATRAALVLSLLVLLGCKPKPASVPWCKESVASRQAPSAPTYHHDVAPLLWQHCARCHQSGGIAPFTLESFQDAVDHGDDIRRVVQGRTMPPWEPVHCCTELKFDPSLSADEVATLTGWVSAGMPEGDAPDGGVADAGAPPMSGGLSRVDRTLTMAQPFTPAPADGSTDETRCFLLDWPETQTRFVTGLNVRPSNRREVHHALALIVGPDDVAGYAALEGKDGRPGWSCPGGVVSKTAGYIGGWSPGWDGEDLPAGIGHKLVPGSKVLLTVHYILPESGPSTPDQTAVDLKLDNQVDREENAVAVLDPAWVLGAMPIAKGKSDVSYSYAYDPTPLYSSGKPIEVFGANLHMHERGSKALLGIRRKDGSTQCLLQIDRWDYHWQGDYQFVKPVTVNPGDQLYVECHWDNTVGHQRVVGGVPQTPRDLNWAEDGEMCVGYARFSAAR